MDSIKDIQKYGKDAKGKRDLIRHLQGDRLTMRQAILSKCFDCTGFYVDGKNDCGMPDCPLYGFMPYREEGKNIKRERTERQVEATRRLAVISSGRSKKPIIRDDKGYFLCSPMGNTESNEN